MKDLVDWSGGDFTFAGDKPERMLDDGNFRVGPGYLMGIVAAAACEMGDQQAVRDVLALADKHLPRLEDPAVLAYGKASVIANAHLASARFAQKDDFASMIHRGPGPGALRGPFLADCAWPGVLVARAMSDGNDLDLVLHNGGAPGPQDLVLERLRPGKTYRRTDTNAELTADAEGRAILTVVLDGRTPLHVIPRSA
jgi:hypothetical protein